MDAYIERMADVIINYSLAVQPGELVLLRGTSPAAEPLLQALYQAALRAGANVSLQKPLVLENISSCVAGARELMMRERRRYFRHPVSIPVSLTANHAEHRAMMVNIGEGGMAVHGVTMECFSLVDFSFQLPLGPTLSGRGQIAWTNRQGLMGIGFQFLRGTGKYDLLTWLSNRERLLSPPKP